MGNVFAIIKDMPCEIRGHVNANKDGSYTIFINGKLSCEMQQEVYLHELNHIMNNDFEKLNVEQIERDNHERMMGHE